MASCQLTAPFTSPSQRGQIFTAQPSISINDVAMGSIMYIREKKEVSSSALLESELEDLSLNHPCLVLDFQHSNFSIYDGSVTILLLTSLNSTDLAKKSANQQGLHLPISPTPAHPMEGYPTLSMAQGQLLKPSYVKMHRTHTVHISMLKYYCRKVGPHTHFIDAPSLGAIHALLNNPPRRSSISSLSSSPPTSPSPPTASHIRTYHRGPKYGLLPPIAGPVYQAAGGHFEQLIWTLDDYGYPIQYIQRLWNPSPFPPLYRGYALPPPLPAHPLSSTPQAFIPCQY